MKQHGASLLTKKALAAALKKLMEQRPLSKISIQDIVDQCGLNRKTFYYHFTGINDLLHWMFEEETLQVVKNYDLILDYPNILRFAFDYVEANEHICNCAYDALGRDELLGFFRKDFHRLMGSIVEESAQGLSVPESYKHFLTLYNSEALAAILIDWLRRPKENQELTKEQMIEYLSLTMYGSMRQTLEQAALTFSDLPCV